MPKPSVANIFAKEYLADGQWHDYLTTLNEVGKRVPPHLAIRVVERRRVEQYMKNHPGTTADQVPPRRVKSDDISRQINAGSREMARDVLANARFQRAVVLETGQELIRLRQPESEDDTIYGEHTLMIRGWRSLPASQSQTQEAIEYRERGRKIREAQRRKLGLDSTHLSRREREAMRRAWWLSLTEEERQKIHHDRSRRAVAARKRNQEVRKEENGEIPPHD